MLDTLPVVLRILSFVLLLQAAGVAIFVLLFGRQLAGSRPGICRLGRSSAWAALAFLAANYAMEAARMTGELSGMLDFPTQRLVLGSSLGAAFLTRMSASSLVIFGLGRMLRSPANSPSVSCVIGVALVVVSFSLTGHTSVGPHRLWLAVLLIAHLSIIAFWFGALMPLHVVSSREPIANAARIVGSFSVIAVWLVPCILGSGVGLIIALVPNLSVFSQPYGELLLLKASLFAVLMGLAALNKWRFGPRMSASDPSAAGGLRRTLVIEYGLLCAVLAATAVMTSFYSPEAP